VSCEFETGFAVAASVPDGEQTVLAICSNTVEGESCGFIHREATESQQHSRIPYVGMGQLQRLDELHHLFADGA
jgi:hypothetical protein